AVAAVLGIGMALIVQDLDLGPGLVGLSKLFIFPYPPEDPTVPPFGNVPFQFEHKIGELPVGDQIVVAALGPLRRGGEHHGPGFKGPGGRDLPSVVKMPAIKGRAVKEDGPFALLGGELRRFLPLGLWFGIRIGILSLTLASDDREYQNKSDCFFHLFLVLVFYGFLGIVGP